MFRKMLMLVVVILLLFAGIQPVKAAPVELPPLPWDRNYIEEQTYPYTGFFTQAVVDPLTDRLYIAHLETSGYDLKFAYSVDPGTGNCGEGKDFYCSSVDQQGRVGAHLSMDIDVVSSNLFPLLKFTHIGIAYLDLDNNAIKYASAVVSKFDPNPAWKIITVFKQTDPRLSIGRYGIVLKYIPGTGEPVIAFHESWVDKTVPIDAGYVAVFRPVDPGTGNSGPEKEFFQEVVSYSQTDSFYGRVMDMDVSYDGKIQLVWVDRLPQKRVIAAQYPKLDGATTCNNPAWTCQAIETTSFSSIDDIAVDARNNASDKYRVAYVETDTDTLRMIYYMGTGGNCNSNAAFGCESLDKTDGYYGIFSGIDLSADQENYPIISYKQVEYLGTTRVNKLMLRRPAQAVGKGNCGPSLGGTDYWYCDTLEYSYDDGVYDPSIGDFSSIAVYPDGRLAVAYSRIDNGKVAKDYALIVSEQYFPAYMPLINK